MKICVVDKSDSTLFGLDILDKFKCIIDIHKRRLTSRRNKATLKIKTSQVIQHRRLNFQVPEDLSTKTGRGLFYQRLLGTKYDGNKDFKISVDCDYRIPANSTVHVPVKYNFDKFEPQLIRSSTSYLLKNLVMIPRGIIDSTVTSLPVTNFSNENFILKKHSKIGFGSTLNSSEEDKKNYVDKTIEDNWVSCIFNDILNGSNKPLKCYPRAYDPCNKECRQVIQSLKKSLNITLKTSKVDDSVVEDKQDFNREDMSNYDINTALTEDQRSNIKDIILKHIDMFAFSNAECFDPRTSKLPELRIKTGDAMPILQRPYRKSSKERQEYWVIVLPQVLQHTALENCHWSELAAHCSRDKTYERLRNLYWWSSMRQDCIYFVKNCPFCQRKKKPNTSRPAIQPIIKDVMKIGLAPFTVLNLDIIVLKDHPSSHGNKYIFTCRDYNTRFLFTEATKNMTTVTALKFLANKIFTLVGFPKAIITDKGTQFMASTFKNTLKQWGIDHINTSGYHPQTSGLVENANKTVKARLASLISENQRDWDIYLPIVTYAINTEVHEITKYSPFYLVFGWIPRDPQRNFIHRQDFYPHSWFTELPDDMAQRLDQARKKAIDNLVRYAEKIEAQSKPRRMVPKFIVGQTVLRLCPIKPQNKVKGFWKPWEGPYKVIKVISEIIYVIKRVAEPFDEHAVNIDTLRSYDAKEELKFIEYSLEMKSRFDFLKKNFRDPDKSKYNKDDELEDIDLEDKLDVEQDAIVIDIPEDTLVGQQSSKQLKSCIKDTTYQAHKDKTKRKIRFNLESKSILYSTAKLLELY
ncbi:Pro-Pol polyprotein [Halotydeus destructor]|nr:Pro-Pol polyprotein [Halotydeus destructor]